EGRVVDLIVDRRPVVGDERIGVLHVVEPLDGARRDELPRALAGVLARRTQLLRQLVVDANRRLLREVVGRRRWDFVVVVLPRALGDVGQGVAAEDGLSDRIEAVLRNLAEHAAVLEAAGRVGGGAGLRRQRILDQVEDRAGVIARLREIAGALER